MSLEHDQDALRLFQIASVINGRNDSCRGVLERSFTRLMGTDQMTEGNISKAGDTIKLETACTKHTLKLIRDAALICMKKSRHFLNFKDFTVSLYCQPIGEDNGQGTISGFIMGPNDGFTNLFLTGVMLNDRNPLNPRTQGQITSRYGYSPADYEVNIFMGCLQSIGRQIGSSFQSYIGSSRPWLNAGLEVVQ